MADDKNKFTGVGSVPGDDPEDVDGPGQGPALSDPYGDALAAAGYPRSDIAIPRHPIIGSSHLKSAGYDTNSGVLVIEFEGGELYKYRGVPQSTVMEFLTAGLGQQGTLFARQIRGKFDEEQLR